MRVLLLLLLVGAGWGQEVATNLALGRPYEMLPSPSYAPCVDAGDATQLTDGQYTEGYYWTQKSTVGWLYSDPLIVIDLGQVQPIDAICVNAPGGGVAGVYFPQVLRYYVSDNDQDYHQVAELRPAGLLQDQRKWYTHKFAAEGLKTRGRYVAIRLVRVGSLAFSDEIEVLAGSHDPAAVRLEGAGITRRELTWGMYGLRPDSYQLKTAPAGPHVPWARPLAGGPIKAVLVAPDEAARDFVELAQRLDLDYLPIPHGNYRDKNPLDTLWQNELLDRLPSAEVLLLSGFYWESLPDSLVARIIARVNEGMGLVVVAPRAATTAAQPLFAQRQTVDPWLLRLPLELVPGRPAKPEPPLAQYSCGQGRVLTLTHGSYTRQGGTIFPGYQRDDLDDDELGAFEYGYALVARAVQWAAGRGGGALGAVSAAPGRIEATVAAGNPGRLEVLVRDSLFDVVRREELPVGPAGGTLTAALPALSHGAHPVDLRLLDAAGRLRDWVSTAFTEERTPRFTDVKTDQPLYELDQPVTVTVATAGAGRVTARLQDTYGRLVATAEAASTGQATLRLPTTAGLTLLLELLLELRAGEEVTDRRYLPVFIRRPETEDFAFCAWYGLDREPMATQSSRLIRDYGVDTVVALTTHQRYLTSAFSDVRFGPENVYRVAANGTSGTVRTPCLTDPATVAEAKERVRKLCAESRQYGAVEISLGDESSLGTHGGPHDFCQSPTCLAAFRDYLKQHYGSLEKLNAGWETTFATWDEVTPWTRAEAEKATNFSRWIDHRRYMEEIFTDFHQMLCEEVRAIHPEARVGLSGTPHLNSYSGHDWVKLMPVLTHLSGYGGIQREIQRSFAREDAFVTSFAGYDYNDDDEQQARSAPWDMLFNGAGGLNYYTLISNTLNCPIFRPDLSPMRKAAWWGESIAAIKAGPASLLRGARRQHDGVAVLYSQASLHAASIGGLMSFREPYLNYANNLSALDDLLEDIQVQYNFVSPEQVASDGLANYRAVILAWNQCLSAAEAAGLRQFAERGGTVIADLLPAIRDEHGKPVSGLLDDLFGAQRERQMSAVATAEITLPGGPTALAVVPQGGIAREVLVRRVGRGRAVLLNGGFSHYTETESGGVGGELVTKRGGPGQRAARAFWRALLAQAEAKPGLDLGDAPGVEAVRYSDGPAAYVALLEPASGGAVDPGQKRELTVTLPAGGHVYDCLAGKYLGQTARFAVGLVPALPGLYAVLPQPIERLEATVPAAVEAGAALRVGLRLRAAAAVAQRHVVRVELTDPSGHAAPWYARNVSCPAGQGELLVPLALNDARGTWRLTARDVATGLATVTSFTVK